MSPKFRKEEGFVFKIYSNEGGANAYPCGEGGE